MFLADGQSINERLLKLLSIVSYFVSKQTTKLVYVESMGEKKKSANQKTLHCDILMNPYAIFRKK